MSNRCYLKVVSSNTGKMLHGNAAVLHTMRQQGGYDNFIKNLVSDIIFETAPIIAKRIIENQNRSLKVIK